MIKQNTRMIFVAVLSPTIKIFHRHLGPNLYIFAEGKLYIMTKGLLVGPWSKKMIGQVIRHVFNRILSEKHDGANN
jgi:hypothetical protein